MSKTIINAIKMGRQRYTMADTVVRVTEGFRSDYMPDQNTWDAFALLLILHKMIGQHLHNRPSNASTLSRATGMPRTTVQRKLAQLRKLGAVSRLGTRYMVVPSYMNNDGMLTGFEHRRELVLGASKKMFEAW